MGDQTESSATGSGAGPAMAIVAVAPRPGLAVRGACPPLTDAEAAGLQTAWLKQIAQELPGVAVRLYGRPADALPMLRYFAGPGVDLHEWRPRAGSARDQLAAVAGELHAAGHAPVLVRTADTPDVTTATLFACLDAARQGSCVLGNDQRGEPWLLACADAASLATETPRRGPWARSVQDAHDLQLLWHERLGDDADEPATLPVRDLQAALRFYEVAFAAELHGRDDRSATIATPWWQLRLLARGPQFAANGLLLPCEDTVALAARLEPHGGIRAGCGPAPRIGGGSDLIATDPDGNRLRCVDGGFAR